MKISDVRILYKILACFGLIAIVVAGAVWFATSRMKAIDASYSAIIEKDAAAMKSALRLQGLIFNFERLTYRVIAETDVKDMKKTAAESEANRKVISSRVDEIR